MPPYILQTHSRLRRVKLLMTVRDGLIVQVPEGFNKAKIPALLQRKQCWIDHNYQRIKVKRKNLPYSQLIEVVPTRIDLKAIGQCWQVEYRPTTRNHVSVHVPEPELLVVHGAVEDEIRCNKAIYGWLHGVASNHLANRLNALSSATGLHYQTLTIRNQKSRWGSCSSRGAINLNQKLMMIAPELVDYILVHELCHTVEMNHSAHFWTLVETILPDYRQLDKRCSRAWLESIPRWLEHPDPATFLPAG